MSGFRWPGVINPNLKLDSCSIWIGMPSLFLKPREYIEDVDLYA